MSFSPEQRNSEVEDPEKEDPHHVDEVPVQGHRGDTDVVLGRELPTRRAEQDEDEQDQAAEHVQAMKARHREEGARKRVGLQRQAARECVDELVQLPGLDSEAEDDRGNLQEEELATIVMR